MSGLKVDEIDMQIIDLLSKDSRIPYRRIAKRLGMSPMAVLKRVKKLRSLGIIRAFTVALDFDKLGECMLHVMIKVNPKYDPEEVASKLSHMENVLNAYYLMGEYDISLIVRCAGRTSIPLTMRRLKDVEGIEYVTASLVLKQLK